MPIFDYTCDQCGHEFEKLVLKIAAPAPNCVSCDSSQVSKQVSAPAFRLGGSGWYETDFKTGKKKNLASGNKESASQGEKSSDKKASSAKSD